MRVTRVMVHNFPEKMRLENERCLNTSRDRMNSDVHWCTYICARVREVNRMQAGGDMQMSIKRLLHARAYKRRAQSTSSPWRSSDKERRRREDATKDRAGQSEGRKDGVSSLPLNNGCIMLPALLCIMRQVSRYPCVVYVHEIRVVPPLLSRRCRKKMPNDRIWMRRENESPGGR